MLNEVQEYFALRNELAEYETKYKAFVEPKKRRMAELRTLMFTKLKETGQDNARFRGIGSLTIAIEKKPVITDEKAVIQALQEKGLQDYYSTDPHLTDLFYESILPAIKSGDAPELPGITIEEKETLRVLAAKTEPLTEKE